MTETASALTLTQPWATLSVAPVVDQSRSAWALFPGQPPKIHETRQYRLGGTLPRRLAIHAGQGAAGFRWVICGPGQQFITLDGRRTVMASTFVDPYRSALEAIGYSFLDPWQLKYEEMRRLLHPQLHALPLGRIVGAVSVQNWIRTETEQWAHAMDHLLGNWEPGRYAWTMVDAKLATTPIAARGYQSVWTLESHQLAELRAQGIW